MDNITEYGPSKLTIFQTKSNLFFSVFSTSRGPRRLKLGQLTDLDVPDNFFRTYRAQRGEKTSKTSRERLSEGSVACAEHKKVLR